MHHTYERNTSHFIKDALPILQNNSTFLLSQKNYCKLNKTFINYETITMAEREWGINKTTGKLEYIKEIEKIYVAMSREQQQYFNKHNKRNYSCKFCSTNFTASSLGGEQQSHFRVGKPKEAKEVCKGYNFACQITIGNKHHKIVSHPNHPCSDSSFNAASPIIDELIFNSTDHATTQTQTTIQAGTPRSPQQQTGKSSVLDSVAFTLIQYGNSIAKRPLKVQGCTGYSYETVIQNLSNMQPSQNPCGTHIFYCCVDYNNLPETNTNKNFVEFQIYMFKSHVPITLKVNFNRWKKPQISNFKKSIEEAKHFVESRRPAKSYTYLFWFGTANIQATNRIVIEEDYQKIYLTSSRILKFYDKGHGLYEQKPAPTHQTEPNINKPEKALDTLHESFFQSVNEEALIDSAPTDKNKKHKEEFEQAYRERNSIFNEDDFLDTDTVIQHETIPKSSDKKTVKQRPQTKKWFDSIISVFSFKRR